MFVWQNFHHSNSIFFFSFAENLKVLQERLEDTQNNLQQLKKSQHCAEVEMQELSKEHTRRFGDVQRLEDDINKLKE